ncbi:MAG TPA: glycosyltransferase family 2 protein [Candidatus Marinimicrobia bacterium]|nr:glycosyltransferase family 2 protein [Candidatus Neomarinimicrobiota bacterium]
MDRGEKIAIVIPVLNGERTLRQLIGRIRKQSSLPVWVVNDGSSDKTAELAEELADRVLHHSQNRGKGEALQTAMKSLRELSYQIMITLDADLQHTPEAIPYFLEMHRQYPDALIIGSRQRKRTMPLHRKLSNGITSALIRIRSGQAIPDSQCGFRLIPLKAFDSSLPWRSGFHFESELLLRFALNGGKVLSVPIPTIYRKDGVSYIHHIPDTIDFIKLYIETFFWQETK